MYQFEIVYTNPEQPADTVTAKGLAFNQPGWVILGSENDDVAWAAPIHNVLRIRCLGNAPDANVVPAPGV